MRIWVALFCIIVSLDASSSSITFSGKMSRAQNWKDVLYLSELKDYACVFSGSGHCIVDSILIDTNGSFVYGKLKANTAYRITSSPANLEGGGVFIQDGLHDNYLFFVTGALGDSLFLEGDLSQLFISHTLTMSDPKTAKLNAYIDGFRSIKKPVLSLMQSLKNIAGNENTEAERLEAFKTVTALNEKTNTQIDSLLTGVSDARIYTIGLVFRGVEFFDETLSKRYYKNIQEVFDLSENNELLHSITEKLQSNITSGQINPLFLTEQYKTLEGELFSFVNSIQTSKILVIDFWASWCLPCRESIKGELRNLTVKYTEDQLAVIGVNLDKDKRKAIEAIQSDKNGFLQLYDYPEGKFRRSFDLTLLPYYVVVNQQNQTIVAFRKVSELLDYIEGVFK